MDGKVQHKKRWWIVVGAIAFVALLFVPGIGPKDDSQASDKPHVLTTFTVVADMVREVAGDRIDVSSITKPGAEIHGYEPTPGDLRRAAAADLVIQNGMNLESWFEQFIGDARAPHVSLTDGVKPIPIAGQSEYAGKPNPHAWMSVQNALIYVDNIQKALTELDPAGADYYAANARRYKAQLAQIRAEAQRAVKPLPSNRRALVSCEGAFSYMARDYGLTEQYLWPVNAEAEGTPQQIAKSVDFVKDRDVPAVFCESTVSNKAQLQVAQESGAEFGGVLYVDSLSKRGGPVPTYLDLLRRDTETIVKGLTGSASR
ncbi:MAG: metal ABC transporter substrate-binding protein [Thermoleophilaceae bacterium]|nr:metal ABC transporter substrate-binding protein [Thermoleophilaceae bacterium]